MPILSRRVGRSLVQCATILGLAACAGGDLASLAPGPSPALRTLAGWRTTADGSQRFAPHDAAAVNLAPGEKPDVAVDTSLRYQPFAGYGAAITDATAWLLTNKIAAPAREQLLQDLFGDGGNLGLDVARIPIGASDFSLTHYTYADTPGIAEADIAPARAELIPALRQIRALNPEVTLIASPWSAPAWMKSGNSLIKGRLAPAHYADFAYYLVSYLGQMRAAGVPIDLLTIQNEPHFEPGDYPGMRVEPAERAAFIGEFLGPRLAQEAPDTRLLDWDHNWDEPESPLAVLADSKAARYLAGVAWHCYAGDVSAQSLVLDRYPSKETWFTECSAGEWSGDWASAFAWSARKLVIGAPRNWARGVVMWNLVLDQNHGPHLGGCGTCRGLVTINTQSGAIEREPEYYAFAHASRFLPRNAVRVDAASTLEGVESVAFLGQQDGMVEVVVYNASQRDRNITIGIDGQTFQVHMPQGSLATFVNGSD